MREFRFGVNLFGNEGNFHDQVRAVENTGADVLMIPDHLGFTAPFPALVAASHISTRMRLGHFVLNSSFYSPALLARDCAATDQLTGGRLEIGLGAGYAADEFATAEIPFPTAGKRVQHLAHTVEYLRQVLTDTDYQPAPLQKPPPIMIAGVGDKVLTLAAEHADIVALSNIPDYDTLVNRVDFLKAAAGQRFTDLELNLIIFELAIDREPDLEGLRPFQPNSTDEQLRNSMNLLSGSFDQVIDKIHSLREQLGISYYTIINPSEPVLADLARVIAAVR